jgi:hypothetical protein
MIKEISFAFSIIWICSEFIYPKCLAYSGFSKNVELRELFFIVLRRMYILQLLDRIFCRCLFSPFDLWCSLTLRFLCWFFFLDDLFFDEISIVKLPTVIVLELSVPLCLVLFLLWNWVYLCLVHIYLQSLYLLDSLFPDV